MIIFNFVLDCKFHEMTEEQILQQAQQRMGIDALNDMQRQVLDAWQEGNRDLVLYSPTGTGKTLAFALCMLQELTPPMHRLQAVVMAPSRELVMQAAQVLSSLAVGYKVTPCYGGHAVRDEKASLAVTPDIVVATPGRLLDHLKRAHIDLSGVSLLVLDEMDKSLEWGFEDEMRQLLRHMPRLNRRIMASATVLDAVPGYVNLHHPVILNLLDQEEQPSQRITVWNVDSLDKDKLDTLRRLLLTLNGGKAIVFANYRESVERIHQYLAKNRIDAGMYHGAMEQQQRENAVAMLNNGSTNILVATDLAARGLDINAVEHIIHYHLPVNEQAYIHRNGRTARALDAVGNAYIINGPDDDLPQWIKTERHMLLRPAVAMTPAPMATLYFQAGKKEKLSRGDIMGFIATHGGVEPAAIGRIDLRDHYALAAVPRAMAPTVLNNLQHHKIKGRRVRISLLR